MRAYRQICAFMVHHRTARWLRAGWFALSLKVSFPGVRQIPRLRTQGRSPTWH